MKLFEITTGRMGESYERCYAWAESKEQAKELFESVPSQYCYFAIIKELFGSDDKAFITKLSDSGFDELELQNPPSLDP